MPSIAHIHPMLVHFPIVFFLTLAVVDTIATLRGVPVTGRGGIGNVSTGLALLAGLFAIVTYIFGGMALDFAEAGGFHSDVAEIHESLGEATAAAFAIWAIVRVVAWWRNARLSGGSAILLSLVELAGVAIVVATAYYGGQLVFNLGVNVAQASAS
jgi:uncharacterized membrane protein